MEYVGHKIVWTGERNTTLRAVTGKNEADVTKNTVFSWFWVFPGAFTPHNFIWSGRGHRVPFILDLNDPCDATMNQISKKNNKKQ